MKTKKMILCLFALLFVSCITVKIHQEMRFPDFAVTVPAEWTQINTTDWDLMLTREGPYRQLITIYKRPLEKPYKYSKLIIEKIMTPQEVANIILWEITSDPNITGLELLEDEKEIISGHDGFRIVFSYIHDGFTFKTVHCGFVHGKYLYNFRFMATDNSIYERDLPDFEKLLKSFRLL